MDKDPAAPYFRCSDRERAAFEAGIKLGALFHQFIGLPVSSVNAGAVEQAMEACLRVQPFVRSAAVRIDRGRLPAKSSEYDYTTLSGDMLAVEIAVDYDGARARAAIEYVEPLRYPLMHLRMEP
jgi:hypothetical protein